MSSNPGNDILRPKRLPKNGTIGIIATATTPDADKLERGIKYLESLGYRTKVGKTCYSKLHYLSGDDTLRAKEFVDYFSDPTVDAIICARGGYGGMHLLPLIDWDIIKRNPKLFVGYSDITSLQWALLAKCNMATLSGSMVASDFGREDFNSEMEQYFWDFMGSGTLEIKLSSSGYESKTIEGNLLPANLAVAAKQMGSEWFPDLKGTIPVFEDIDEPMHKIEGYLRQFALYGAFKETNAIVFGDFKKPEDESFADVPPLELIFKRVLEPYKTPYAFGLQYGHIPNKISMPVGVPFSLSLGVETTLRSKGSFFQN